MILPKTHRYLSPAQYQTVQILANDGSYMAVRRENRLTPIALCSFLATIRRKTGIENTKDMQQAKDYLTRYAQAVNAPGPSADQLEILQRVFGIGKAQANAQAIGYLKNKPTHEITALYEDGLNAAGVLAKDARERRVQGRIYLASTGIAQSTPAILTRNHFLALRLYADGLSDAEIIREFTMKGLQASFVYLDFLIGEGCDRLGVRARGRGVQRRLVAVALDQLDATKTTPSAIVPSVITMDDPTF